MWQCQIEMEHYGVVFRCIFRLHYRAQKAIAQTSFKGGDHMHCVNVVNNRISATSTQFKTLTLI